jgi:hypothetical protein
VLAVGDRRADQEVALVEIDRDDAGACGAREIDSGVFLTVPRLVAMNTKCFSSNCAPAARR